MAVGIDASEAGAAGRTRRRILDRSDAVARARSLAPGIGARVDETNSSRRIPDATMAELHESGLLGILTPNELGGSGLGPDALFAAAVELARVCGSTGWTYGVLAGHTALVGEFPEETQREVFADADVVISSLLRLNTVPLHPVDGGYRLERATGRFCSGVDHSDWLIGRCSVEGSHLPHWVLIPRSDYEVLDDWYTVGLCGTGSKSLVVAPTFVPAAHVLPIDPPLPSSSGSSLPFSLCGAAIGCAYAAIEEYRKLLAARGSEGASQSSFIRLAKATADADASYLMVLHAAQAHLGAEELSPLQTNAVSRNIAYAVQQAREVANAMFAASGGSGIYSSGALQRIWRDANAASAHTAFVWETIAENFGKRLAGGG